MAGIRRFALSSRIGVGWGFFSILCSAACADSLSASSSSNLHELGESSSASARASSGGSLEVQGAQYFSFPKDDPRSQLRFSLVGVLNLESETNQRHFKLQAGGMFSPGRVDSMGGGSGYHSKTLWYAYVPEAYVGLSLAGPQINQGSAIYLGRRKEDWSQLDDYWQLGIWQPRFRWDCLAPETQGLTGLFYEYRGKLVQWTAVGSPLFIPEQGPSYSLENGRFTTESPCFEAPVSQLPILSQQTGIDYHVNMPPLGRILFHPSGAATVRVGRERGLWGRASYAYKPVNQIFVDYDGYLQINQNQAQVELTPRVSYHQVAALESGVQGEKVAAGISLLAERPEHVDIPWNITGQQLRESIAVGPTLTWNWLGRGEDAPAADLGYLRVWGGQENLEGPLASSGSIVESHYAYHDVASLGVKSKVPGAGKKWRLNTRYRHDFSVDGNWISAEFRYVASAKFSLGLGADILGVGTQGRRDTSNLISRFRGNDRVYGGVRYVF